MQYFLPHTKLNEYLIALIKQGYQCIGPQVRNGSIVFDQLKDAKDLPWGIEDHQQPGKYRLKQTNSKQAFAWANGPQAIKPFLFKPKESLWRVEKNPQGKLTFKEIKPDIKPIALIGVRSCDVAGMVVQDKTFIHDVYKDERYQRQREKCLVIAVNCSTSGGNCFCVSTNTGPKVSSGFDLAWTEINDGFVVTLGTEKGEASMATLNCQEVTSAQILQAQKQTQRAANQQTKRMPYNNDRKLRDILMNRLDHPRWDEVASRCLSCGNCTAVCPTCFCHHETETASLTGDGSEHGREWDSCFTEGHSYIHGKVIRDDTKSRYKQWLTHKLGTWWDQFDTSGCVGCGRCITWCPVGIDITEEMAAIADEADGELPKNKDN